MIRGVALQNRRGIRVRLSCCQTCTVIAVAVFHQHQVCPQVYEHRPQCLWPSLTVCHGNDNRPYQMGFDS